MNSDVAERLIALNRKFYDDFGASFSATRSRLQPGVSRILESIREHDSVLDLGCGNGHFLAALSRRGHRGALLGVDFSLPLLREAGSVPGVRFLEADLTRLPAFTDQLLAPVAEDGGGSQTNVGWSVITMFATLHHIPSNELRLDILRTIKNLLRPDGRFILSNWQFLNSEKLKSRIQPWSRVGIADAAVDEGDTLLDWRSDGEGLRYAHHFSAAELTGLAEQAGLRVIESFLSDGENGRLGLYQVWTSS